MIDLEALAKMEEIERPWAILIGLITLQPSDFVPLTHVYKVDFSRNVFSDQGQTIVINPESVIEIRKTLMKEFKRSVSDNELAAWLWWRATRGGK